MLGFRCEFDDAGQEAILLSPLFNMPTADGMCLRIETSKSSVDTRLNISLLLPTSPASNTSPSIELIAVERKYFKTSDSVDYYVHSAYNGLVKLRFTAYNEGSVTRRNSMIVIRRISTTQCISLSEYLQQLYLNKSNSLIVRSADLIIILNMHSTTD